MKIETEKNKRKGRHLEREKEMRKKEREKKGAGKGVLFLLLKKSVVTLSQATQIFVLENELTNIEIRV